ncbi:metallophosphoesterase family protein [Planctomicrobium sp. SH664]|uniref:metallophosphoesterase family protein n=1 Tax=Planctomicrobium sp. SH664 TaxID=3448125 RepID=UPI003F5B5C91
MSASSLQIGVVSDTHGDLPRTRHAVELLKEHSIAAVLHCGDIVSPEVIPLFNPWPTHFVFGNCDAGLALLRRTIEDCGQTCHERFGSLKLGGRSIAFLHGDDLVQYVSATASNTYDLVCYGHTHKFEHHLEGKTLVLNPGAIHRANPHSFAIVDLPTLTVQRLLLDDPDS